MPPSVLVLFAHPALEKSRVNVELASSVRHLDGVTFHDLYEAYPDFDVQVGHEQELLLAHRTIVFQHPFFWYSTPALLKQWLDLVLVHGWAYGSNGTALAGKQVLSVITTGARESTYVGGPESPGTIRELLAPLSQTFRLCSMDYLPPFVAHGTLGMTQEEVSAHARDYRAVVESLRDGTLDIDTLRDHPRLNWRLAEGLPRASASEPRP